MKNHELEENRMISTPNNTFIKVSLFFFLVGNAALHLDKTDFG